MVVIFFAESFSWASSFKSNGIFTFYVFLRELKDLSRESAAVLRTFSSAIISFFSLLIFKSRSVIFIWDYSVSSPIREPKFHKTIDTMRTVSASITLTISVHLPHLRPYSLFGNAALSPYLYILGSWSNGSLICCSFNLSSWSNLLWMMPAL